MTTNSYNNVAAITGAIAEVLENRIAFAKTSYHGFDDSFKNIGAKHGDTANLRVPGFASYRTGQNAQPTAMNDTYVPITLTQGGSDFMLTSQELTLNIDDLKKQRLDAMASIVASEIDYAGMSLYTKVANTVGTPGTQPTNFSTVLAGGSKLAQLAVNSGDLYNVMHPDSQAGIVNGMSGTFNPAADISEQYRKGTIGYAAGFAHSMDSQAPTHTYGTYTGTPTVVAPADGATTIVTAAWTAADTMNVGDTFTVANVYAVNPITKRKCNFLKQFVVTSKMTADGGGAATVSFDPPMLLTGPTQNIDALPVTSARITPTAATGKVSPVSFVGHPQAFVMASADLELIPGGPDVCHRVKLKDLNMSVRVSRFWNGMTDQHLYRLDVLFGWALYRPQFVVRNQG